MYWPVSGVDATFGDFVNKSIEGQIVTLQPIVVKGSPASPMSGAATAAYRTEWSRSVRILRTWIVGFCRRPVGAEPWLIASLPGQ
jgi:hypothetical protein